LHFFFGFLLLVVVLSHFSFLHETGSGNPLGVLPVVDFTTFAPYYFLKDALAINAILLFFFYFVFLAPDYLGHTDNYIAANNLVTPMHIVPEWYLLPLYAVLRSVTNKLLGILILVLFFVVVLCLPLLTKRSIFHGTPLRPLYGFICAILFAVCFCLA
jgi:ubiquinol-cytochrome c reductase cytochrome b subunit